MKNRHEVNRMTKIGLAAALAGGLWGFATSAIAEPWSPVPNPVPPGGPFTPRPYQVPGKEYSHELDRSSTAAGVILDDQQNTKWNGIGGIDDTDDYNDGPGIPGGTSGNPNDQVDAIANVQDVLFDEVVKNQADLLFSLRQGPNPPGAGVDVGPPVWVEYRSGSIGDWASWDDVDQNGGDNLDGLEVWGPDNVDDANRFSLFNDAASGCSIWAGTGPGSVCYATHAEIAALFPEVLDPNLIDVDALMVSDKNGGLNTFDVGDGLMFSLWPIAGFPGFGVGDAVYVWEKDALRPRPDYLDHGGHYWTDGRMGINVDALEAVAVPEPASLALMVAGLAGFAVAGRRKKA